MSQYNTKCPHCNCNAYIGFSVIECSNRGCKYFVEPKPDDDETKIIDRTELENRWTTGGDDAMDFG